MDSMIETILYGVTGVSGMFLTLLVQKILNKRGLFTYFVNHTRVGVSTTDVVFGTVQVTWNNNVVANLYLSTVELINASMKDFENVIVRAYTNDTMLLSERTEIVGTTHVLEWTADFSQKVHVPPGQIPSEAQQNLYWRNREYLVPTMNRGQIVRFHFLNSAKTQDQPSIWLDVVHKGVKLKYRLPQPQILGEPQGSAALIGGAFGLIAMVLIIMAVKSVWLVALCSFLFGYLAILPGAYCLKTWRWLREFFSG